MPPLSSLEPQPCFYCPYQDEDKDIVFMHMNNTHLEEVIARVGQCEVKAEPVDFAHVSKTEPVDFLEECVEDIAEPCVAADFDSDEEEKNVFDSLEAPTGIFEVKSLKRAPAKDLDSAPPKKISIKEERRASEINKVVKAPFEELDQGEEKHPLPCVMCHRRFKTTKDLKAHDHEVHGLPHLRIVGSACNECSILRNVRFRPHLVKHMRMNHTHPCHLCQAEVTTRFTLNLHLKHAHKVDVSLFCDFCPYQADDPDTLSKHKK